MHIAIIGATGGVGEATLKQLAANESNKIYAFSRCPYSPQAPNVICYRLDLEDETSIAAAVNRLPEGVKLDAVLVLTGLLHTDTIMPEKSISELSAEKFAKLYAVNTIGPALVAKHFLPKLATNRRAVFAAISARIGSISDNRKGGWYSYRAAKAGLNMIIKNLSIEHGRRHKQAIIVGLHPGTVDTALSKPFQKSVPDGQLFTPEQSAAYLLDVMQKLTPTETGKCFAWDGKEILP